MYASSIADLGRFEVPIYVTENWIPAIRYLPEPPAPIRGAMNPWQQERQRVLWIAEEKAWKQIQVLQREWAQLESRMSALVIEYNNAVSAINARMEDLGKGSPLQQMNRYTSYASFVPGFGLIPRVLQVTAFIEQGIKSIFGITARKKKDIENWMRELNRIEGAMVQLQQRMETIMGELQQHLNIAQTVASQQQVQITADLERSEALYAQRQVRDIERGKVRQRVYRQLYMTSRQPPANGL